MKIITPGTPRPAKTPQDVMRGRCDGCGCYIQCIRVEAIESSYGNTMLIACPQDGCVRNILVYDFPGRAEPGIGGDTL